MRKVTLFVFLISSLFVSAQETESVFAPIGAKWYYGIQSSIFSPDQYFRTIESIKDTLIQDKTCSVLEIRDFFGNNNEGLTIGFTYIYSEQQKIFSFNKKTKNFELLYDFSANVGDSWNVPCIGCGGESDFIKITVTSVETVNVSGRYLKRIYYTNDGLFSFGINDKNITEFIGGDGYLFLFGYAFNDMNIPRLRCYSDGILNYAASEKKCDFITTSLHINEFSSYPGIAVIENKIYFLRSYLSGTIVNIYDLSGTKVLNAIVNSTNCISIENLKKGIYFIQLDESLGLKTIKLLKS